MKFYFQFFQWLFENWHDAILYLADFFQKIPRFSIHYISAVLNVLVFAYPQNYNIILVRLLVYL
jgi:hypothetical protein